VRAAYTETHLLAAVQMKDPVAEEALDNVRRNKEGFLWPDHVTINILRPSLDRYLFAVNPAGARYSELNLDRDTHPDFTADVEVVAGGWEALFAFPFGVLGVD
jgi:hypothetical protein